MSSIRPGTTSRSLALRSLALGLLFVLAGCGPSGGPGPGTPTTITGGVPTLETAATPTVAAAAGVTGEPVDVCSLVTPEDVAPVLGQTPLTAAPGDEPDQRTGNTVYFCTYLGQGLAVVISVAPTGSPDAARSLLEGRVQQMQAEGDSPVSESEAGLGDVAFWTTTSNGASFDFGVGSFAVGVSVGGSALGDPSAHRDALKVLAQSVASGF